MKIAVNSFLVAGLLLALLVLVTSLMNPVRLADALGITDYTMNFDVVDMTFADETHIWIVGDLQLRVFDTITQSVVVTRALTTDDPTVSGAGDAHAVECRSDICYIWLMNSGTEAAALMKYEENDGIPTWVDTAHYGDGGGVDIAIGGLWDTVYIPLSSNECGGSGGNTKIVQINGDIMECGGLTPYNTGAVAQVANIVWSGLLNSAGDTDDNHIGFYQGVSGADEFRLLKAIDLSSICSLSLGTGGDLWRAAGMYWLGDATTTYRFNIDDTPNCVIDQTISSLKTLSGASYDGSNDLLYLTGYTNNTVAAYNFTGSGNVGSLVAVYHCNAACSDGTWDAETGRLYGLLQVGDKLREWDGVTGDSPGGFDFPIGVDIDGDGEIDFYIDDDNGDGIPDFELGDAPLLVGNASETIPNVLTVLAGVNPTAAVTIVGILVPIGFVSAMALFAAKYDTDMPLMVYGLIFLGGMVVSVAMTWLEPWWVVVGILGFAVSFAGKIKGMFV